MPSVNKKTIDARANIPGSSRSPKEALLLFPTAPRVNLCSASFNSQKTTAARIYLRHAPCFDGCLMDRSEFSFLPMEKTKQKRMAAISTLPKSVPQKVTRRGAKTANEDVAILYEGRLFSLIYISGQ